MFSRQRKARVLFGLSDLILATAAFEAAYQTRAWLPLQHQFFLTIQQKALVLGFSLVAWVAIGLWLEVYEKLDSGHPRIILRDSFRQCLYGAVCVVVFEYVVRLELSRPFLMLFSAYAWVLLLLFRLTAGRVVGVIRREFAAPHYVMVVGTGERALRMGRLLEESAVYGVRLRGFLNEQAGAAPGEIAVCVVVFEYVVRLELSRPFLMLFSAYAWVLLLLFRLTAGRVGGVIRREFAAPHYVMVVGTGERALRMGRLLEESAVYGVRLRGFLNEQAGAAPGEIALGAVHPVRPIGELPSILRQHVVDEVVFAVGSESLADLEEIFLLCDEEGVRTRVAVDFFPHVNSTVSLDRFGTIPLLTFSAAPYDEIRLLVKRSTDVVIAAAGLVVLAPLMALIVLMIRLTSPGPAIFRQVRCGLNGRRFLFYKFRSMVENAEDLKLGLAHLNTRDDH